VSCCNATTEGSDVSSSSQQEVTCPAARNRKYVHRYVWLVGILGQGASQPVAEDEAEVSLSNHSSERELTTDKLLKASSYLPNTETSINSIYFYDFSCLSFLPDYITAVILTQSCSPLRTKANFASDLMN